MSYYGAHERHAYDLFGEPSGDAPVVVFVHGGYWQALDRSFFSHMAKGPLAHGLAVAVRHTGWRRRLALETSSMTFVRAACTCGRRMGAS
jgi:hypothetical protein